MSRLHVPARQLGTLAGLAGLCVLLTILTPHFLGHITQDHHEQLPIAIKNPLRAPFDAYGAAVFMHKQPALQRNTLKRFRIIRIGFVQFCFIEEQIVQDQFGISAQIIAKALGKAHIGLDDLAA